MAKKVTSHSSTARREVITSDPVLKLPGSETQRILERNFGSVPRAVLTLLQRRS